MTLPVTFNAAAQTEFVEAAAWYEAQRPGLGAVFIAQVEHCLRRIAEQPARYPVVHNGVRRVMTARFPYSIYFDAHGPRIVVLAVFHGRRDPASWQRRVP
ncbi:MAG: type II toxin-antitoxin system RelE/ParE family toxin [Pseudomonadota bacterium]